VGKDGKIYANSKKLAIDIKAAIKSFHSRTYCSQMGKRPEKTEDVYSYIENSMGAKVEGVEKNRELIFGQAEKPVKIFYQTLFGGKRTKERNLRVFICALMMSDSELYGPLLIELLREYAECEEYTRENEDKPDNEQTVMRSKIKEWYEKYR
jgi:hypothetical protein